MTVPQQAQTKYTFDCNGLTTSYPYPVPFLDGTDLVVRLLNADNSVNQTLALGIGFTIVSGEVVTAIAHAAPLKVQIDRDTKPVQDLDLVNNDEFPAESIEKRLDRPIMVGQEHRIRITALEMAVAALAAGNNVTLTPQQIGDIVAEVLIDPDLLALFTPITGQITDINQIIGTVQNDVTDLAGDLQALQAEVDTLEALSGDAGNFVTLLAQETVNRTNADSAMVALVSKIGAAHPDGISFLLDTGLVKVTLTESLAQKFTALVARHNASDAAIAAELVTRANADTAEANARLALAAVVTTGDSANAASIVTEANNRASADGALSSQISTVSTTVGGHTASIQSQATSINGIQARYSVKVDNNGHVSGFGLISEPNNGTIQSTFVFLSDVFKIFNGSAPIAPFSVSDGIVYIQNAKVTALSALSADMGAINAGTIALATTGHIRAGQTAYNTGVGFFLGFDGATPKFSIGNPAGQYMAWDGTNLVYTGQLAAFSASIAGGGLNGAVANGRQSAGSRTVTVVGGRAPLTYVWSLNNIRDNQFSGTSTADMTGDATATVTVFTNDTDNITRGNVQVVVTDADGRMATAGVGIVQTHGTPL